MMVFAAVVPWLPQAGLTLTEAMPDGEDPVPRQPPWGGKAFSLRVVLQDQLACMNFMPVPYLLL